MPTTLLRQAAELALTAPSIFNSQPWAWLIRSNLLELRADRTRQLRVVDPDGRLLTLSCGVALHHARLALSGQEYSVVLLPEPDDPDLLAAIQLAGRPMIDRGQASMLHAVKARRTDRRTFTRRPVDPQTITQLVDACAAEGAGLHVVGSTQIAPLALAAVRAGALELSSAAYRAELADWTHRPPWSGDGVPVQTAVDPVPRHVPVRDFAPFDTETLKMGIDNDMGATYAIIHTGGDGPLDWLRAGQALSAVLLTATAAGLATAPISDVTEVTAARDILRDLLASGEPQVAVRIGHPQPGEVPSAPRRLADEVITVIELEA